MHAKERFTALLLFLTIGDFFVKYLIRKGFDRYFVTSLERNALTLQWYLYFI